MSIPSRHCETESCYNDIMKQQQMFKTVSLFSGCGGLDFGLSGAGFDILGAIERDPYCCESLTLFDTERPVIEHDIRQIDPKALFADLNLHLGEVDLLCGGPPCQSFSQIGKQNSLQDERGLLLFEMIRFANALQPKVILVEQVKGLLSARDVNGVKGAVFEQFLAQLEQIGYETKWKVINAADFGVPQLRKRVFIVATRESNQFQFPEPTHSNISSPSIFGNLKSYEVVGHVIAGLDEPELKTKQGFLRKDSHVDPTPDGDRRRIHGVREGRYLAGETHLPKTQIKGLTKKDTTKFLRVCRSQPSKTLRGGEIFFHPTEDRYLTPREYMRIHGFPDGYLLAGPIRGRSGRAKYLDQYRQIANSVPPPVAKALGLKIRAYLCQ